MLHPLKVIQEDLIAVLVKELTFCNQKNLNFSGTILRFSLGIHTFESTAVISARNAEVLFSNVNISVYTQNLISTIQVLGVCKRFKLFYSLVVKR